MVAMVISISRKRTLLLKAGAEWPGGCRCCCGGVSTSSALLINRLRKVTSVRESQTPASTRKVDKATWKRQFKLPWRKAGPPNRLDDKVDPDQ